MDASDAVAHCPRALPYSTESGDATHCRSRILRGATTRQFPSLPGERMDSSAILLAIAYKLY